MIEISQLDPDLLCHLTYVETHVYTKQHKMYHIDNNDMLRRHGTQIEVKSKRKKGAHAHYPPKG